MILIFLLFLNLFSKVYTLNDCLFLAEKNNKVLKSIEYKKTAGLLSLKSSRSLFFPKITGEFSFSRLNEIPQMNVDFMGMSQSFKVGSQDNYKATLSLIQPVFTAGKIRSAYKIEKTSFKIISLFYDSYKSKLSLIVKQAYYGTILSKNVLKIRKEAEDFLKENLEVSKKLFEEGRVSSYDVSRNEVSYNLAQSATIEAENNYKISLENLSNIIGVEVKEISEEFEKPGDLNLELKKLIDFALKNNPELKKKKEEVNIAKYKIGITKSSFFPQIYAGAGYVYENPHYSQEEWGYNWNLFLNLQWDIFSSGKKIYDVKKEKQNLESVLKEYEDLKSRIKLNVKNEFLSLKSAYKRYLSQKENVELAKKNLEIARERYNQGLLSHLELKDARVSVTEAELKYLKAIYDWHISLSKLLNLLGVKNLREVVK